MAMFDDDARDVRQQFLLVLRRRPNAAASARRPREPLHASRSAYLTRAVRILSPQPDSTLQVLQQAGRDDHPVDLAGPS
jgi:hypothetical protein